MNTPPDSGSLRRILLVDDEPNIINAVTRELGNPPFGRYRFEIEGFTNPLLALDRAREQAFDLVISDYRMPEMDGLGFLKAFLEIQPTCAPIVLSGQTDTEALIKMVNQSNIFRFIPKPWHDYFLKSSIFQALAYYGALKENQRLANLMREQKLEIPRLMSDVDQILVVGRDEAILQVIAHAVTSRSKMDEVYAAIYAEINDRTPVVVTPDKLSVQISTSIPHVLKMADEVAYSCIILCLSPPLEKDVKLLQDFADKQPDCARLIVRGDAVMDYLVTMLDLTNINGIIGSVANEYEMKVTLAQALMRRRLMLANRILADMIRAT